MLADLPGFCNEVPYQIKNIEAVSEAKRKFRATARSRRSASDRARAPSQSVFIPGSAISDAGIYPTISGGGLVFTEPLPEMRVGKRKPLEFKHAA
jgi:putative transposase